MQNPQGTQQPPAGYPSGQPGMGQQPGMGPPGSYGQPGMQQGGQPGAYGQPGMQQGGQPGAYGQPGMQQPGAYGQSGMPQGGQYGGQPGMQQGGYGGQSGMPQGGYGGQPGMQQGGFSGQPGMQQGGYPQGGQYGGQPGVQGGGFGGQPGMQGQAGNFGRGGPQPGGYMGGQPGGFGPQPGGFGGQPGGFAIGQTGPGYVPPPSVVSVFQQPTTFQVKRGFFAYGGEMDIMLNGVPHFKCITSPSPLGYGHSFSLMDLAGNNLCYIQPDMGGLPHFHIYLRGQLYAILKQDWTQGEKKFELHNKQTGEQVKVYGDWFGQSFEFQRHHGGQVGQVSSGNNADLFDVMVAPGEDALFILAATLTIEKLCHEHKHHHKHGW